MVINLQKQVFLMSKSEVERKKKWLASGSNLLSAILIEIFGLSSLYATGNTTLTLTNADIIKRSPLSLSASETKGNLTKMWF